jgi:hypothetical protein
MSEDMFLSPRVQNLLDKRRTLLKKCLYLLAVNGHRQEKLSDTAAFLTEEFDSKQISARGGFIDGKG